MTSEPVGNSARSGIHGLQGNSHKSRESVPEPEPREKVEKVIEGKVVTRKKPFWKRAASSMIADDATSIGDFVMTDLVIPGIKNLIYDIGTQALGRSLYGDARVGRRPQGGIMNGISSIRTKYDRVAEERPRVLSREARARHDFAEVILDSRSEAVDVIERLIERVERYGSATVSDLYDFVGVTGSFADQRWGWTDLRTADVRQLGRGFLLDLPAPEPLR